jgi:nicotinate-nucleotide pyrophosphorylase (carboxylating)
VICGLPVAAAVFAEAGDVKWFPEIVEGARVDPGVVLARIEGPLRSILTGERTALNILQRLSGVATLTSRFVESVAGSRARIVDTRKTTPGLRVLEKYAVAVGGASNHRFGLDDGILVKDNHVAAAGGVGEATRRALEGAPLGLRVEVEVRDLDELEEAIEAGANIVLLDNMQPDEVASAVERASGRVLLEVSGGITLDSVSAYAATGIDLISVGALTHSAPAVDLALEVEL